MSKTESQMIVVKDEQIPVNILYEYRKNSRVSIGKRGVNIRISNYLNKREKQVQIDSFKNWAIGKIAESPTCYFQKNKQYNSGQTIAVMGTEYTLQFKNPEGRLATKFKNNILYVYLLGNEKSDDIAKRISRAFAVKYRDEICKKVDSLNDMYFQKTINRISLKYTSSVWGSCSRKKNINLSTRLLLAPDEVLHYVIIHELAHLIQPNHSKKFWDLVAAAMPDYKRHSDWLKIHGRECDF